MNQLNEIISIDKYEEYRCTRYCIFVFIYKIVLRFCDCGIKYKNKSRNIVYPA